MFLIFSISRFKYLKDYIDISIKKKKKNWSYRIQFHEQREI